MRWVICGLSALALFVLLGSRQAAPRITADRWLAEFTNDDGSIPDGSVANRDDSSALRKALNVGPGVVRIGPGRYRITEVAIPQGVTLVGSGQATILQAFNGKPALRQAGVRGWRLRDVCVQGEAEGDWRTRTDQRASGLEITGGSNFEVTGVQFQDFNGAGLQIGSTNLPAAGFTDGGLLSNLVAVRNFVGIRFDTRGEYVAASQLQCHHNLTGIVIHAGNANIANSNIGTNVDGIVIDDRENGSHGSLTGCLVNHNDRYAIHGKAVLNGMAISNCCFFYGSIRLENCQGINITSSLIGCSVATAGDNFNRFAGNHIIPEHQKFDFAPATMIEGNFTTKGPWELNRPAAAK